jgi:hypothetical protein
MIPSAIGRRFLGPIAVLAVAASVVLVGPRIVKAFTLPPDILFFDPISVPVDHTLHVHLVNHLGAAPLEFRAFIVPTTPAAGASVVGSAITLNVGAGSDHGEHTGQSGQAPAGRLERDGGQLGRDRVGQDGAPDGDPRGPSRDARRPERRLGALPLLQLRVGTTRP